MFFSGVNQKMGKFWYNHFHTCLILTAYRRCLLKRLQHFFFFLSSIICWTPLPNIPHNPQIPTPSRTGLVEVQILSTRLFHCEDRSVYSTRRISTFGRHQALMSLAHCNYVEHYEISKCVKTVFVRGCHWERFYDIIVPSFLRKGPLFESESVFLPSLTSFFKMGITKRRINRCESMWESLCLSFLIYVNHACHVNHGKTRIRAESSLEYFQKWLLSRKNSNIINNLIIFSSYLIIQKEKQHL